MFARLKKQWRGLRKAKSGKRFQNRYYGRKKQRANAFTKLLYLVVGSLLTIVGIVRGRTARVTHQNDSAAPL